MTTTTQQEALTTTIATTEASESGALAGHSVSCTCGLRFTTSLGEDEAQRQADAHLDWHQRSGR